MESVAGLVAAPTTIDVGDRQFTMSPIPHRDYAVIERRILEQRGDPIVIARRLAEGLSQEERKELFQQAYKDAMYGNMVSTEEYEAYRMSHHGFRLIFWLGLRVAHPDITEEEAAQLADEYFAERLEAIGHAEWAQRFLDFAMGLPQGNSPSPAMEPGTTTETDQPTSHGNSGTDTSQKSADGLTQKSET